MEDRLTKTDLERLASDIIAQVRAEYPAEAFDEALSDMCEAVIYAEGMFAWEAQVLRRCCGI